MNVPKHIPPRWAQRLLTWLHPDDTLEEVEGDLDELYAYRYERAGKTQATLRYLLNVVSVLPPFVRRRQRKQDYYQQPSILKPDMLQSYLTTALRALKRNWNYTVINVVGLTFGLACCLILFLAIRYELSYDRHHTNADRTYRLITHNTKSEGNGRNVGIPLPALAALRADFPELKHQLTMVYELYGGLLRAGDQKAGKFLENQGVIAFVEPAYFRLFDYQWKSGNALSAVTNPNTAVLSERAARKYFGDADPMGKTIRIENKQDFTVTGVVQNPPVTSSLPFEVLLSFASLKTYGVNDGWDDWGSNYSGAQIYMTLPANIAPTQIEQRLAPFIRKYIKPEDVKNLVYELQPFTTIHFDARTGKTRRDER